MEQTKLTASVKQETLKETNNEQMKKRKSLPSNKKPILKETPDKTEASGEKVEKEKVEEKCGETEENKEEQIKDRAKVNPHHVSLGSIAK